MASLVLQPVTAPAQTPNSQISIAPGPLANTHDVTFFGIAGRVYIIQISSDLVNWVNAPFVELGSAADITWRFSHTGNSRCFLRLVFTNGANYPAGAGGDVDGDGVSNLNEITSGTDPFNPDTDGDGQRDNLEGVQTSATRYRVNLKRRDANGDALGLPPLNDPSQPDLANPPPGTLRYYGINVTWPATLLFNPNAPPTQSQRDADYLLRVVAGANAYTTDPATGTTSATGPVQPFNSNGSIPVGGTTATAKAYKRTTTYVYSQIFPFPNNSTQGASVTVTEALNTPIPQNDGDVLTWLDQQLVTSVGIPATPPVALCNTLGPNSAQREILRFTWSFPTAEPQRSIFWSETFTPEGGGTPITKIKSGPAPGLQSPEYTIDPNVENGGACGSYVWNRISTELDVNGDGDVSDSVDGLVNYLPGYEGPTAKLHTGIRFTTASYSAPQAMRLILTGLGSASVDNAEFKITAVTSYDGYCGNGSDPAAFAPGKAEDFSFHPTTDQRILAGTISANQIQAPIYAKDYGAWATVELTLSRGGIPLGPPLTFTLPGDSNGDRLADRWQDPEIKEWNRQYGTTRPLTEAERDQMKPPVNGFYPDDEPADSDGLNNGDGGRNLPAMPTAGDGLTILEEYRGYLLDYGKASPAGPLLPGTHQRLSTARKEALFQCHIMPEIQDAAQNNANAAAQQFSLANTFNAAVGFYADLQKGPALDLYAVEIPITDAGPLITYVDGSMRPA